MFKLTPDLIAVQIYWNLCSKILLIIKNTTIWSINPSTREMWDVSACWEQREAVKSKTAWPDESLRDDKETEPPVGSGGVRLASQAEFVRSPTWWSSRRKTGANKRKCQSFAWRVNIYKSDVAQENTSVAETFRLIVNSCCGMHVSVWRGGNWGVGKVTYVKLPHFQQVYFHSFKVIPTPRF